MDQSLPYERVCPEEGATGDEQTGRLFTLFKTIWDNITEHELHEIKQYLKMMDKPKFGKAQLEKVRNGVDLLRLLQERDLLGINDLSFIKTLLKHMNRNDLLREVNNYQEESVKAIDAKPRRPKPDPTCAPSDSTCESRHFQQSIDLKKHEIEQKGQHRTHLSTQLKNLKEENEKETDIIADSEKELTKIELEKEQKKENERKCKDKREKKEAKIRQLQKECSEELNLERSFHDDVDRMSQTGRDVQNRISHSKYKKDEISKQCMSISAKEKECSQTINILHLELNILELQINQPRQRPHSNENVSDLYSGAFSDVTTDALPTERANTINKAYRTQHEPTPSSHNTAYRTQHEPTPSSHNTEYRTQHDPTSNIVIIISAEENVDQSSSFQDDLKEIQGEGTLICDSIVVRGQLTEEFLNVTNDKIPQAKLVFMLFSQAFVKNCWPEICKMKNFNSAIYDNKPLIVPVSAEQNTKFPMGMKSAHNLSFHRRDAYYKEALKKLVRPYIM